MYVTEKAKFDLSQNGNLLIDSFIRNLKKYCLSSEALSSNNVAEIVKFSISYDCLSVPTLTRCVSRASGDLVYFYNHLYSPAMVDSSRQTENLTNNNVLAIIHPVYFLKTI